MENKFKPLLQNRSVILRPLEQSDEQLLWSIAQEEGLWQYGIKDLSQPGELKKYIQSALEDREQENAIIWIVLDAKTQEVAGCTRLAEISWNDERGQIGWTWIGKAFRGSGINQAMKYEILNYAFEILGLNRVELKADERNLQSRRAIEKIGAQYEGTLREHMKIKSGYIRNSVFYSILKREWPSIKQQLEQRIFKEK